MERTLRSEDVESSRIYGKSPSQDLVSSNPMLIRDRGMRRELEIYKHTVLCSSAFP